MLPLTQERMPRNTAATANQLNRRRAALARSPEIKGERRALVLLPSGGGIAPGGASGVAAWARRSG